jgi:hypothetical protein
MSFISVKKSSGLSRSFRMTKLSLKFILLFGLISLACTTRVSEWVLLNSFPEKYSLIYYCSTPVSEKIKKQNDALKENFKQANLNFSSKVKGDLKQPYYALYYKNKLFAKYDNQDALRNLESSPLRKKIASELLEGKLCVMLYLKIGNEAKDKSSLNIIQKAVKSSPFKDILTVLELDRENSEEVHFTSLLLNVEEDLKNISEPMLFGIFGKFKALEPLLAGGISEENINLMIDYLKAECSCLIKDDLPGTDILYSGNWENPKPALLNKIIDENPTLGK